MSGSTRPSIRYTAKTTCPTPGPTRPSLIQQAFNPVAVIDTDFWSANRLSNEAGQWPTTAATVSPGTTTRILSAFNDTFAGTALTVFWRRRLGSATGDVVSAPA